MSTGGTELRRPPYVRVLLVWALTGLVGGHHFYLGRHLHGLLWLTSFGGFGVGWLLDLFRLKRFIDDACTARPPETQLPGGGQGRPGSSSARGGQHFVAQCGFSVLGILHSHGSHATPGDSGSSPGLPACARCSWPSGLWIIAPGREAAAWKWWVLPAQSRLLSLTGRTGSTATSPSRRSWPASRRLVGGTRAPAHAMWPCLVSRL